jgi:hypothetical protein
VKKNHRHPNPNNIDPNLITQGTVVRVKAQLGLCCEFTALATVISRADLRAVPGNRHPSFKLLDPIEGLKDGHEFWGTTADILEIVECPKL